MATLPIYNLDREEVGTMEVDGNIFAAEVKQHLFYEVVKWQLAKRRAGTAATKGRSLVSGGGQKPYKQKGTGRARQGSRRAPNHVGGGVVHGPQPRSYAYTLNKKVKKGAMRSALSLRASQGALIVVRDFEWNEVKTAKAAEVFGKLAENNAIVVDAQNRKLELSVRNLPKVTFMPVEGLNVYDVLKHKNLVLTEPMVRRLEGVLAK